MARKVFFSFHYQRDVVRAAQVRNSWVTKKDREYAGFWDKAKWESIRRGGDESIKHWINRQLKGTSVTVVLIGSETYGRKYVNYEINRTCNLEHGLLGIYIHRLKNFQGYKSIKGKNPFDFFEFKNKYGKIVKLSSVIKTYDWIGNNGYLNLGHWVELAAKQAGL